LKKDDMENVIAKDDPEYPELLRQIGKEAPKQLYYKGNWEKAIFENCLAVVGSRRLTGYGKRAIEQLVGKIAAPRLSGGQAGITIVSGFMYGGDAAAHQAAVEAGGRTIAVMPCGIERIHPEYQKGLYNKIMENNGLIVSEYKGNRQPALWTYPRRNRIVAGLAKALLVVEAGDKSGSLITANYAKKFGRKIFALPGQIGSRLSEGTNRLIKEGAEMVLGAEDILRYFQDRSSHSDFFDRFSPKGALRASKKSKSLASKTQEPDVSKLERRILEELEIEPLGADELSRQLAVPAAELGVKLSLLEVGGIIEQEEGKWRIKE